MNLKEEASKLYGKWDKVLAEGPAFKDEYRKAVTTILLENQLNDIVARRTAEDGFPLLNEAVSQNASGAFPNATNLKGFDPIMIGMVRRAAPNFMAHEVCGVQPMSGPTGLIFFLKAKYTQQGGTEALFNEANTAFSGKGTQAGTNPATQANSSAYKPGTALTTAEGEALGDGQGTLFAEMAMDIGKVTATAGTRALAAGYTVELAQDLRNVHNLDAEGELSNICSNEVLIEMNRELVRVIYNNAIEGAQDGLTTAAGIFDLDTDSDGRWLVERFKGLMVRIDLEANAIAKATRRGRGNILITSSDVATALSMTGLLDSAPALKDNLQVDDTGNTFVGILNNRFRVYVDPYVDATEQYFVVGYKGSSPFDAGLFFCPYIGLQMYKAVDPLSMQPRIAFKTRYAIVANPFATSAANGVLTWKTNIYYRKVAVTHLM